MKKNHEKIRSIVREIISEITNPYSKSIEWTLPTDSYFRQELSELLGNEMRWDKGEFFHPANFDKVFAIMPYTFRKIAEKAKGSKLESDAELKGILLNKGNRDLKLDWGKFRHELMNDTVCQNEGLKFFKKGGPELVDWDDELISDTFYMGKPSKVFADEEGKPYADAFKNTSSRLMMQRMAADNEEGQFSGYVGNLEKIRTATKQQKVEKLPAPFVVKLPSGGRDGNTYNLIGGHKRSSMANQLHIPIKVWLIDLA